jgi:quercetin dioxygenase-like cupin family protein
MKAKIFAAIIFAGGALIGAGSSEIIHAQVSAFATRQVFQTDLNNLPGQEVLLFASTWQPGFRLPLHMHPGGHEITYVVEGEQTFEIDGVGTKIVKAGEAIYTPRTRRISGATPPTGNPEPSWSASRPGTSLSPSK